MDRRRFQRRLNLTPLALLVVLAALVAAAITAMLTWIVRRVVVLFALLEAAERIEENAPHDRRAEPRHARGFQAAPGRSA